MLKVYGVPTRCWAHRGASGYAPENTAAAFRLAAEMGADGIELDVRVTRDRALVVCHDVTLERFGGVARPVAALTLAEVKQLDVGAGVDRRFVGERILTLEEALDIASTRLLVNIEVKVDQPRERVEERIVRLLRSRSLLDRTVLSSFLPGPLERTKRVEPELATALLYSRQELLPEIEALAWAVLSVPELRVDALHLHHRFATPAHVAWAHAEGFGVAVWTVNDEEHMQRLVALGVEGIFTDYPDRLVRVLQVFR